MSHRLECRTCEGTQTVFKDEPIDWMAARSGPTEMREWVEYCEDCDARGYFEDEEALHMSLVYRGTDVMDDFIYKALQGE